MKRTNKRRESVSPLRAFAVGLAIHLIAFFLCTLVGALIVGTVKNPLAGAKIGSVITLYVGGGISGFCAARYKRDGACARAAVSSLCFCLALLAVGLIASGGAMPAIRLVNYAVYILISSLLAFMGSRERGRRHK